MALPANYMKVSIRPPMTSNGYLRYPTISDQFIVFTAEDDLWRVPLVGGRAERLTPNVSTASAPRFSPDGRQIAFSAMDEGPQEIYVMDAEGGPARRITFQTGAPTVKAWSPDGTLLIYSTNARQPLPGGQILEAIAPEGGEPLQMPFGQADAIAYGPNGALVLGRHIDDIFSWKRYRGGSTGMLWIDRVGSGDFVRLLPEIQNLTAPGWIGDRLYFIADHEGMGDVYSVAADGSDMQRHTHMTTFYARNLTTDGRRWGVFHAGGDLYLLDGAAGTTTQLEIHLPGARSQSQRRFIPPSRNLEAYVPHPYGHTLALTTRGKVFSMANFDGAVSQHGEPDGVRYRLAAWLPDGKRLVAVADDGSEPHLVVFAADGAFPDRELRDLDIGHVVELLPAPRGEQVLIANHRNEILVVDLAEASLKLLERSPYGRGGAYPNGIAWSPDATWVAFGSYINSQQTAIKLAHVASGEVTQVTDPVVRDFGPSFDPRGRYLYFLSERIFDPVHDNLQQTELSFPKGIRPYLVTLRDDLLSPFRPPIPPLETEDAEESDQQEEGANRITSAAELMPTAESAPEAEEPATEASAEVAVAVAVAPDPAPVPDVATPEPATSETEPEGMRIDLAGIQERIVAFRVPEGRFQGIWGTIEGALLLVEPVEGAFSQQENHHAPRGQLWTWNLERFRYDPYVEGVDRAVVTADGRTMVYRSYDRLRVVKVGEKPSSDNRPGRESGWIDLGRVRVTVQPDAEWRQMFGEAWRLQREQFWASDMVGIDWRAMYERYAPLLDRLSSRGELSDLIREMQGELGTSHTYERGWYPHMSVSYSQGFLGVDWRLNRETGGYGIERLVRGDAWDPDATSPLIGPGLKVAAGDEVVAINGQRLSATRGPQQLLVGQAGQDLLLLIRPADGSELRRITVTALAHEFDARYREWVVANRRQVHEATDGQVGYIHIPNMSEDGFAEFHRAFLGEYDRAGLIIDVRWNTGGYVSWLLLEKLARHRIGYDFPRHAPPIPYPKEAPRGPLVALINEDTGSDGDVFSHAFKLLRLGPLIGQRTWGGTIGIHPYMRLVDGSSTTQPEYPTWFYDIGWGLENHGTEPDIPVEYRPQDYAQGRDPQLERAIAVALEQVAHAPPPPQPSPRPNLRFIRE